MRDRKRRNRWNLLIAICAFLLIGFVYLSPFLALALHAPLWLTLVAFVGYAAVVFFNLGPFFHVAVFHRPKKELPKSAAGDPP